MKHVAFRVLAWFSAAVVYYVCACVYVVFMSREHGTQLKTSIPCFFTLFVYPNKINHPL